MLHGWMWPRAVLTVLLLSGALSLQAWAEVVSLGTIRGSRAIELTMNDGKSWLPLGGKSLPLIQDSQIRSTVGNALIELSDGSRLHVLPFNTLRLRKAGDTVEVTVVRGRLSFQLAPETAVEIVTPSARLTPAHQGTMAGEVFVNGEGVMGLQMTQGTLHVQDLTDDRPVLLASQEPVFIPQRPVSQGPLFSSEAPASPPSHAKGVFNPKGESIGYLGPDGRLNIHPSFTADLTRPFPGKIVRVAMATIPATDRAETIPLFDVNGKYLGYLDGAVFHPQHAQVAQAVDAGVESDAAKGLPPGAMAQAIQGGGGGGLTGTQIGVAGGLIAGTGTLLGLCISGLCDSDASGGDAPPPPAGRPATPFLPLR